MLEKIKERLVDFNRRLKIPRGYYCYNRQICPYWRLDTIHIDEQENGFCEYLMKSDWDINEELGEIVWTKSNGEKSITKPHEIGISLIWDQCKMCDKK